MLRFRDLVTEPSGTIAEHRRIIHHRGFAWWGWWSRQWEIVPRSVLSELFPNGTDPARVLLFDSGTMRVYESVATKVVVAPTNLGVQSPDLEATPDYYARGRYPAWFRLVEEISQVEISELNVLERPTVEAEGAAGSVSLDALRDDRPTLWVVSTE